MKQAFDWLPWISQLDHQPNAQRRLAVKDWLVARSVLFERHQYATGCNLIVKLGEGEKRVGLCCHTDRVKGAGGANDNASAMAICLQVIHWACEHPQETPPLTIYFMDEEEVGLKGSIAYLTQHRVKDLRCLLNLEMLGMGDRFALWPLHESDHSPMISAAQSAAAKLGTSVTAFDRIVTNTADHVSFRNVGVRDCFSLTGISTKELSAAEEYYAAMKRRAGLEELTLIMQKAPVFEHYHRETDTADKLNEQSLARAALLAWLTLTGLKAD